MVPVGVYDRITLAPCEGPLQFSAANRAIETNNLVLQACERLGLKGAAIHLEKDIPIGAGLGGGSSDAAAILLAAQRGAFGPFPALDWLAIARALGSDVPFFLCETGALVEGTGERVTPLGPLPPFWATIVHPEVFVATGGAYALLDAARGEPTEPPQGKRMDSVSVRAGEALQRGDFNALERELMNDFRDVIAAQYPPVAQALRALAHAGAAHPMLSGSGSAVFALAPDRITAEGIANELPSALRARMVVAPLASAAEWRRA